MRNVVLTMKVSIMWAMIINIMDNMLRNVSKSFMPINSGYKYFVMVISWLKVLMLLVMGWF